MKKLRIYLDTSVISHLEAGDAPDLEKISLKLWDEIKTGQYQILISELVLLEIQECQESKKSRLYFF